jgi:GDPmannose 4,6-dehydratase
MTGRSALVTGAAGQDGILLSELLVAAGYRVWAMVREGSSGLPLLRARVPDATVLTGDLRDAAALREALRVAEPDEVYNLAAFSSVGRSWAQASTVVEMNALAVVGLLDEVRRFDSGRQREVRFYQASSSEMFGSAAETPQTEETPFHPRSPYGVAKSAAHFLTVNYRESYNMFACSGILYNHESPLRPAHFVTRKISQGVAAIATGRADHLQLGSIDISRDWGYAPDYVRAMWLMLQQDEPADYIVASGRSRTLREFLTAAFACIGIGDWSTYVRSDAQHVRPAEVAGLVGDATRARSRLGWSESVTFEEIVEIMVDHDLRLMARTADPTGP